MRTGKKLTNTTLRIAVVFIAVIGAFAAAGCLFTPTPPKDIVEPVVPDSPENVVFNLELAYNKRDIQLYKQCLSPDYTFYFNPSDVGNDVDGYVIPTSWGYEDDWTATQNMFTRAYDISMQLPENDIDTPPEGATEYTADEIGISLQVLVDAGNGFIANKGTIEFAFETYDSSGKTYWRIKDFRDFTYK